MHMDNPGLEMLRVETRPLIPVQPMMIVRSESHPKGNGLHARTACTFPAAKLTKFCQRRGVAIGRPLGLPGCTKG